MARGVTQSNFKCVFSDDCQDAPKSRMLCNKHYVYVGKHGLRDYYPPLKPGYGGESRQCSGPGCTRVAQTIYEPYFCKQHYHQENVRGHISEIISRDQYTGPFMKSDDDGVDWRMSTQGYWMRGHGGTLQLHHRLVFERHLGRKLLKHENVHHLNGDRADNRIENLELWNTSQPPGQRVSDKVAWAIEILKMYSPESIAPK